MTTTLIPQLDTEATVTVLEERGWRQYGYGSTIAGPVCMHGAIRLCAPVPGDAYLIEQIERAKRRFSTAWNDAEDRTKAEIERALAEWPEYTDEDLEATFGPQWRAVVVVVRQAAVVTEDEARRLATAWTAALTAARDAAWDAAWDAARDAASNAAWIAARDAARDAAQDAAQAVVAWDLATADGPYTIAQRDLLIAPWVAVFGLPDELIEAVS